MSYTDSIIKKKHTKITIEKACENLQSKPSFLKKKAVSLLIPIAAQQYSTISGKC